MSFVINYFMKRRARLASVLFLLFTLASFLPLIPFSHTLTHHRLMDRSDQTELTMVSYLVFGGVVCSKWQGCKAFSPYELPPVLIGDIRAATSTVLLRLASGRAEVFPQRLSFHVICLSGPGQAPSPRVCVQGNAQCGTLFFSFHLSSSGLDFLCLIWSWHSLTVCRFAAKI